MLKNEQILHKMLEIHRLVNLLFHSSICISCSDKAKMVKWVKKFLNSLKILKNNISPN